MSKRVLAFSLALGVLAAPVLAQDATIDLVNETGLTLVEFHAAPLAEPSAGAELLAGASLAAGANAAVTVPNGGIYCQYDTRAVLEDGSVVEEQADVCVSSVVPVIQ